MKVFILFPILYFNSLGLGMQSSEHALKRSDLKPASQKELSKVMRIDSIFNSIHWDCEQRGLVIMGDDSFDKYILEALYSLNKKSDSGRRIISWVMSSSKATVIVDVASLPPGRDPPSNVRWKSSMNSDYSIIFIDRSIVGNGKGEIESMLGHELFHCYYGPEKFGSLVKYPDDKYAMGSFYSSEVQAFEFENKIRQDFDLEPELFYGDEQYAFFGKGTRKIGHQTYLLVDNPNYMKTCMVEDVEIRSLQDAKFDWKVLMNRCSFRYYNTYIDDDRYVNIYFD